MIEVSEKVQRLLDNSWKVPQSVDKNTIRDLLRWVGDNGINNLKLKSDYEPMFEKGRGFHRLRCRKIRHDEMVEMYVGLKERESADNVLQGGEYDDFNYYLPPDQSGKSYGFRVCATGCRPTADDSRGMELMLRTIPEAPPTLEWNKLPKTLEENLVKQGGLIMVVGAVNSGKSTLLASVLRHVCTNTNLNGYTIEDPAEYDFSTIPGTVIPITQIEVGKNIPDFSHALRILLRKSPHFAMYGESRDTESIRHMGTASETGITVYTTVHCDSAAEAIPRMIRDFPIEEQNGIKNQLVTQTRIIVFQKLIEREDGTLTAVREYIILTKSDRKKLMDLSVKELPSGIIEMQKARKTDFNSGLDFLFMNNEISRAQLDAELKMGVR